MVGEEERQIRAQERESLRLIIQQWNSNRLDLFEISEPDENLVFHGVMRFYFQDSGQKVATKCIRVTSTTTTRLVIETLIEKFRPDMRMLSVPQYSLYEIHENGDERRLADDEKPLLVQLNWNKDDREGRFLLRRMDINGMKVKTLPPLMTTSHVSAPGGEETFTRKLSKREKKELKKQEKMRRANEGNVAEKLYTELPETSFTRSISNPEAVMQRRRAQKLEKKLQQFRSKDGGPDTGGTLKIYGESLCQDVPYKTLLLSVRDTAASVVREMLEKYGLNKEDPAQYCLVQCIVTAEETVEGYQGKIVPQKEYVLDEDECPLAILMNHPPSRGSIMFQVRRRQLDHGQRRRKKKPMKGTGGVAPQHQLPPRRPRNAEDLLPFLVELGQDGSELGGKGRQHLLQVNVTEVGSDRSAHTVGQSLQLFGPHIQPRHCVIAHTDGIVTVTPCSRDAETYVNFQRIYETTILQNGSVVRFGKIHSFRFVDPQQDEGLHHHSNLHSQFIDRSGHDVTGKIDHFHPGLILGSQAGSRINSLTESQNNLVRPPFRVGSELQLRASMPQEPWNIYEKYGPPRDAIHYGPPRDPILPAVLEFHEEIEDAFFHNITTQLDPTDIQFKLAPTYTLYMAARFRASTHYRPELTPTERAHKLTLMLTKVSTIVHQVIEVKQHDSTALAFWMANASELLHFLRQDRHICGYSLDAQDILAEAVQFAFKKLVDCMQAELSVAMPEFLEDRDDSDEEEGVTAHVLSILTNTMAQLRRCRVNAALSIQLFSHLFHYISAWVFNKIVVDQCPNYCTRLWGERVKERLSRIELWAEKGGLEFAADRDLAKLSQASLLLVSPKSSPDDVATLSSSCFKLNSLQLREMLEKYETEPNEVQIPKDFVESVVTIAETTADCLAREDGREIRLEEEPDLQVQFLVPEDGYSCDIVRGVPSGLAEFLEPLQMSQLCRMTPQPTSSGFWTIYMHNHQDILNQRPHMGPRSPSAMSNRSISIPRGEPEVHTIQLQKSNSGMGLSIVATKGENQDRLGIYIKSVVPGGAADQDGRLQAGDQLLSVDGKSLLGISQEEAAQYMVGTGPVVTLEVARQGALYHGLAPLLAQPSPPQFSRGVEVRRGSLPLLTVVDWTSSLQDQSHHLLVPPHTMPHIRKPPEMPRKSGLIPNSKSNPNIASAGSDDSYRGILAPSNSIANPTNQALLDASSLRPHSDARNGEHLFMLSTNTLDVGIIHRQEEETRRNPNLPKYTFTPAQMPTSSSCGSLVIQESYQDAHPWDPDCPSALNCSACERKKPWRSLNNLDNNDSDSPSSDSSLGSPPPLPPRTMYKSSFPRSVSCQLMCPLRKILSSHRLQEWSCDPSCHQLDTSSLTQCSSSPNLLPSSSETSPTQPPFSSESNIGVAGQRREAVLPSQTLPTNFTPFHHVHHPQHGPQSPSQSRIQASKSVPSLNSNEASMGARNAPRDAFSTSYSRTSSTSSGLHQQQQQQQQPIRSKSTQNLNEGPLALMGRHPSSPALHNEDDRHYQNVSFHQGPQDPKMGSQRGVRPNFGSGQLDQRPMSAFMQRDALTHVQRPSSQQNLRLDLRQGLLPEDIRRREDRLRQSVPLGSPGFTQGIMSRPPQPKRYGQMQLSPTVPTGQLSPPGYYPHSAATIQNLSHSYPPQMSPQYSNSQNVPWLKQGAPPPTAPKPNRFFNHEAPDKPSRHTNGGHSRPTIPEEGYRDSPPPPPPPASTHPLLQANPIRAAPLNTGSPSRKGIKGPWDKDEKEKYEMQKREAAHRWRDEQIAALESLELRTPKEEERMNTLKLEKEFQKRAEAAQCDEDEEEGLDVEAEKTTSRSSDSQPEGGELTEESRTKAEEIRMKQRELEMTKEAEQQLLREAQRRQEEEMRRHHRHQHQATQRLDSLLETQGTVNGVRTPYGELNAADMSNPLPPERGSSYSAMHNSMESRQTESFGLSGPAKRVQFSETSSASESMIAYEAHQDKTIREDPYNFINDAENFLNSSPNKSTGNTPGVIGAQEVYRDPRQRRLMEQAQKAAATRSPGPEKLTFREKMKMFAMEAEEVAIPKKAQREVDSS